MSHKKLNYRIHVEPIEDWKTDFIIKREACRYIAKFAETHGCEVEMDHIALTEEQRVMLMLSLPNDVELKRV